ncbi:1,4-dihydroxy-2-naphthoate octaprenyltransferase [Alloscardovia venturai]|uniref:1,4-dihydroxy-2-naphthoate octaprenyltransferase n=1 Tax=Alloscardovia venturai TaxID=1769421 RepID=A0ABW2Y6U6_9BIFI
MSGVKLFWKGSRPLTWALSVCPVLIAAISTRLDVVWDTTIVGRPSVAEYPALYVTLCVIVAWSLQVAANFINDYYDGVSGIDDTRDSSAPLRVNVSQEGRRFAYLSASGMALLGIVSGIAVVALSKQWWLLVVGVVCLAAVVAYSVFFARLGLGEVIAFIFFGPVVVWCVQWLLIRAIGVWGIVAGVQTGLLSAGVMLVNNLRDKESDAISHKVTIVVRWGRVTGNRILALCLVAVWTLHAVQCLSVLMLVHWHTSAWNVLLIVVGFIVSAVTTRVAMCGAVYAREDSRIYRLVFFAVQTFMVLLTVQYALVLLVLNPA